jgi:hypothetical protein
VKSRRTNTKEKAFKDSNHRELAEVIVETGNSCHEGTSTGLKRSTPEINFPFRWYIVYRVTLAFWRSSISTPYSQHFYQQFAQTRSASEVGGLQRSLISRHQHSGGAFHTCTATRLSRAFRGDLWGERNFKQTNKDEEEFIAMNMQDRGVVCKSEVVSEV